jgi:hypothetical protein
VWTNTPQTELFNIIDEFRLDYALDDTWNHALDIIEEAILKEEYDRAEVIFHEMRPPYLRQLDYDVFMETLDTARWDY